MRVWRTGFWCPCMVDERDESEGSIAIETTLKLFLKHVSRCRKVLPEGRRWAKRLLKVGKKNGMKEACSRAGLMG